jgi:hypothetical protein
MQRTEKPFQVPDQSEASFPINYAGLHRLEFRSQGGLSFPNFWHASTQLFQREQALLVCIQQPIGALLHASYRSGAVAFGALEKNNGNNKGNVIRGGFGTTCRPRARARAGVGAGRADRRRGNIQRP